MKISAKRGCCINCNTPLKHTFTNLGTSPLCEEFVKPENVNSMQRFYPLHAYVCEKCLLVQVHEYVSPEEIYADYYYFSSYSDFWLNHARTYVEKMITEYEINKDKFVVEIASNDGYLIQYFIQNGIPFLGVEPSENVARVSIEKGIPTEKVFFGRKTATVIRNKYRPADLVLGNNVLAHVPKINDFVSGIRSLLSDKGIATFEFPHLMQLVDNNQFDTIYHEHFSYFSFLTVNNIFSGNGLRIFDVEELPTHGGSLRIYASRTENSDRETSANVAELLSEEEERGFFNLEFYTGFEEKVRETKRQILELLITLKKEGKTIVGYGAPGKGNTLLNYCGIRTDFIDYTVDRNPQKHGCYLPGSLIPICHPDKIKETKPDYVIILPWNLKEEITSQISYIREWGGKFIVPIPKPEII